MYLFTRDHQNQKHLWDKHWLFWFGCTTLSFEMYFLHVKLFALLANDRSGERNLNTKKVMVHFLHKNQLKGMNVAGKD